MESKVIFKSVGQGDTIIIQHFDGVVHHIGIIDCKLLPDKSNPVVTHLDSLGNFRIAFVCVSHPHADHIEGMESLMRHFEEKRIRIRYIYTTYRYQNLIDIAAVLVAKFGKFELPKKYVSLLDQFTEIVKSMKAENLINEIIEINSGASYDCIDDLVIRCYSPSPDEKDVFENTIINTRFINKKGEFAIPKAGDYANLHSSVLLLKRTSTAKMIFLTSDALKETFNRLNDQENFWERISSDVIAAQIPHHGSKRNFDEEFWRELIKKSPNFNAVISVGRNKYNHPSIKVLRKLKNELGVKQIKITDKLGKNYTDLIDASDKAIKNSHSLNYISCISHSKDDIPYSI